MPRRVVVLVVLLGALRPGSAVEWVPLDSFPMGVQDHAAAYDDARARVVIFGGSTDPWPYGGTGGTVRETWEWDGRVWVRGAPAPRALAARQGHAMVYDVGRSRTVMFGGSRDGSRTSTLADTWEYDGSSWIQAAPAPPALTPRWQHAMCHDASRGVTLLFGGEDASGVTGDTWEYDGTWHAVNVPPGGPGPQAYAAMTFDTARRVAVLLGQSGETWELDGQGWAAAPEGPNQSFYSLALTYDLARGRVVGFANDQTFEYDGTSWTTGPPAPPTMRSRVGPALAFDAARGATVLFSSASIDARSLSRDTWLYDGRAWSPGPAASPHTTSDQASAAHDALMGRTRLYTSGGYPMEDALWELSGSQWQVVTVAPRDLAIAWSKALAFDSARRCWIVVAGWSHSSPQRIEAWEYDDAAGWSLGPQSSIPGRGGAAMAFDALRANLVVFGGTDGPTHFADTWSYDGAAWRAGPSAPPGLTPRRSSAMAFDPGRGVVVLFGGCDNTTHWADTWEYSGTLWQAGAPAPPALSARASAGMSPLGASGDVVLFGGGDEDRTYDDTWRLDAAGWSLVPTTTAPADREGHAMTWDSAREAVVVTRGGMHTDTWELVAPPEVGSVAGAGHGQPNANRVRLFDRAGIPRPVDFHAYAAGTWGVNAVAGNVDGGSYDEIVTGPGPGAVFGPHIRAFRRSGVPLSVSYYSYGTLKYGANVGVGNVDVDVLDELLTGAGPSSVFGPQVRTWDLEGATVKPRLSWFAYPELQYGVVVGAGDVEGDGFDEILTAAGPGPSLAPRVRGWDADAVGIAPIATLDYHAFPGATHGARVTAGDADGDGLAEVVAATGPGINMAARIAGANHDGQTITPLPGYDGTFFPTVYGARAGQGDLDGDGADDLLAGAGPDPAADSTVNPYAYRASALTLLPGAFVAFPGVAYGAGTAGGNLGP